jgi:DNA recombination protein RmuC
MKEQAGLIQKEVQILLGDVVRLDDRVGKLQDHFGQAAKDIEKIRISTGKVSKRAERIELVQLEDDAKVEVSTEITEDAAPAAIPLPLRADGED